MNKKDLKTGMTLEFADGRKGVVHLGHDYGGIMIFGGFSWCSLGYLNDDLSDANKGSQNYDCIAVYKPVNQMKPQGDHCTKPIWEREKPAKEMTMADLERELGYKVKVVK